MLLGACGGDDDDGGASGGQGDEYVDAVAASMSEDEETPLDAERADCAATAIVEVVGPTT